MHDDISMPESFNSRRLFAGLFLAAYAMLLVDLLTRATLAAAWPVALPGVVYVLLGTFGFARVERKNRAWLTWLYFALMLSFGVGLFAASVLGGTFLLLVVAAQAVRVLPWWGFLLIGLPLPLLHAPMAWPYSLREGATFLTALVFLYVQSRAIREAERARAALAVANQQLRAYAAQREELATERERNRIAREIHDGLGHYLTTIHMQIQAARATLDRDRPRAEQTLARAQGMAHEALDDVRRSVAALRLGPADQQLPQTLAALADTVEAAGLPTTVTVLGDARPLGPQVTQALYRAAQEGLTNAQKHATAQHATLTLDYRDPAVVHLSICDNGQGARATDGGFGLIGLRERVQQLGGQLCIDTAPGAGLTLTVEVAG